MDNTVVQRLGSLSGQQTLALTLAGGIAIGTLLFMTTTLFIEPLIELFQTRGPPVGAGPPPEANAPANAGPHRAAAHRGPLSSLLLAISGLIGTVVVASLMIIYQTTTFATNVNTDETQSDDDPLMTLRKRYASGEIDDDEFKRRVNRISDMERDS
ncbi:SHOCT domain-containing protein [Haloquadratum walsbyi]|jgi:Predicted membrane protein (DUF2078).|uniref:Putative membrane protein (DUF2078) n=1 Tax=Haloquadratum walsbyi J07HQW2 TaxID=1238425 RepID=U1NA52_9EURY|nr:SHOCT domain-containing protein [Haloquadratum walsbyi]ERG93705.1 MAG: putative membrane protein (DUF2078) [Haloquadratum walsbyi J07HQW2]